MADRAAAPRFADLPAYVVHADWSSHPKGRWMAVATRRDDGYQLEAPKPVGEVAPLIDGFRRLARSRSVVLGFDFPIGVPEQYAAKAGISSFPDALLEFGHGAWQSFYDIARTP